MLCSLLIVASKTCTEKNVALLFKLHEDVRLKGRALLFNHAMHAIQR
jgi:hypothetical protein